MSTAAPTPVTTVEVAPKVGLTAILIPVLLSTFVVLAAVGGGLFWLIHAGKLGGASVSAAAPGVSDAKPIPSHVLALEPVVVNLSDGRSYLRAGVSLRLADAIKKEKKEAPKDPKAVDGVATALRDTTLSVLSSSSADSLLAPEGHEALKKALEDAYKQHNADAQVLDVYFTEFLVQRG